MPYVFGYGSLVDRASVEASLGRAVTDEDGPYPVRLNGYRRSWNMAAHTSLRPDYAFHDAAGNSWEGWVAFLGIEEASSATTLGALYRVDDSDFVGLDLRERSYDRTDVADRLDRAVLVGDEPVYTYVPKAEARRRAADVAAGGIVMARYLRLVDRGYRTLGDELYAEHVRTLPPLEPFSVSEITVAPRNRLVRNEAVDPIMTTD